MNTPSPLIPKGAMVGPQGKSNIRIAVFTILAVHIIMLGALLLQGCKRSEAPPTPSSSLMDSNDFPNFAPGPFNPDLPNETSLTQIVSVPISLETNGSNSQIPFVESDGLPPIITEPAPGTTRTSTGDTSLPTEPILPAPAETEITEHKIVSGDSFYSLAKQYKTTIKAIAAANPNRDPRTLQLGDIIRIPEATPGTATSSNVPDTTTPGGIVYVVKSGDSLWKIANDHDITIKALRGQNNLTNDRILVGQKLSIPK